MNFDDLYKKKISIYGNTIYDRKTRQKGRSFEYWFNQTPNRRKVKIDGEEHYAVIQDHNQSNNKDLSDDKFIITRKETNLKVGSLVDWFDGKWLVTSQEAKTIELRHKQAKMKECNIDIKWVIDRENGYKICNNGEGYPAYVQNQTLYTLGVSTSTNYTWIGNAKMMMYLPNNEETIKIKRGQRFYINDGVYKVMFADSISRRGIIHYLMEETSFNDAVDNKELGVADYYKISDDEIIENNDDIYIEGNDLVSVGDNAIYKLNIPKGNNIKAVNWIIDTSMDNALVEANSDINISSNSISVHVKDIYKNVGKLFSIVCELDDGTFIQKVIKIGRS